MDTKLNINAIEELSIPVTKLKDPENLTTGFANDLTGRNEATAEEFTLRPSAGNISIRDDSATIKRIKGNSIVWNQMISTPPVMPYANRCNLSISDNDINATVNSIEYDYVGFYYSLPDNRHPKTVNGHTYFISGLFSCPKQATVSFGVGSSSIKQLVPANTLYSYNTIQKQTSDTVGAIFTCWIEDIQVGDTFKVQNWNVIDLTQMFGAGNEPDTVEEFRALFPGNHYEYNPGQLVSMSANGLFTNGFNQWDGKVEVGYIHDETGDVTTNQDSLCTDFIRVIPNQKYYINTEQTKGRWGAWYDANKNYIAGIVGYDQVLTAPANAAYVRLTIKTADSGGNPDIFCLNLSHTGVENGKYEPYWDATKDLSIIQKYFPNGMRSAGSIYDEISFDETTQKWVAIQRVGNVDLGSLSWAYSEHLFSGETVAGFKTSIEDIIFANTATTLPNITVSKYNINTADKVANGYAATETFTGYKAYKTDLSAYFTFTTDASEFKSSLSGVMLNYELAEPIVTVIEEPINLSYKVGDFGIEQILSDSFSAPFRADIVYQFNATDRIRENSLNIEKLSKIQNECLLLAGGTMSGQLNSQDIKPVEDNTYQLGDSTHKYKNVFSDFFTGNLEGNAKTASDLTGRIEATPEVFTYHPSAGDKSIKDDNAFIRRVKGNSVVWNQLVNGSTYSNTQTLYGLQCSVTSNSREIRVVGTYAGDTSVPDRNWYTAGALTDHTTGIVGHKYLCHISGNKECSLTVYGWCSNSTDIFDSIIKECTSAQQLTMAIKLPLVADGTQIDETIIIDIHDLTAMFGTGNEPTTVEEFHALYPDSYYPYNAGELRNLVCSGIKTVGFNLFDEDVMTSWSGITKDNRGWYGNVSSFYRDSSNNRNKLWVNTMGYTGQICVYIKSTAVDARTNFRPQIHYIDGTSNSYDDSVVLSGEKTSAEGYIVSDENKVVDFVGFSYGSIGYVIVNDFCINLHHTGYRDGEYEPYKEVTHALPLSQITNGEPLRKAGSVYDEINETHYIKRVGVVDLGSLEWSINQASTRHFWSNKLDDATLFGYSGIPNLTCTIDVLPFSQINTGTENISISLHNAQKRVVVCAPNFETTEAGIAALKASLSGVLLHYELAEPIVKPIETPIDFNYYVEDFGTEEALLTEDSAPFSADIVYQFNATDTIRVLEKNIKQLLNKIISLENTIANAITNSNNL